MGFIDDDLVEFDGGVHPPDVGVIPERREKEFNNLSVKRSDPDYLQPTHGLMLSMSLKPSGVEQPECVARYCDVFSLVQVI